jgi:hypothetical protein
MSVDLFIYLDEGGIHWLIPVGIVVLIHKLVSEDGLVVIEFFLTFSTALAKEFERLPALSAVGYDIHTCIFCHDILFSV